MDGLATLEREKYEKAWAIPNYGKFSPGGELVSKFVEMVHPFSNGLRVIDFGCGDGTAAMKLADIGFRVTGVDHVDVRKKKGKKKYDFVQQNLWEPFEQDENGEEVLRADFGFCCDVMEHIPEDKVNDVLLNIFKRVRTCFFSISFVDDAFGKEIGEKLHLTVKPFTWWKKKIEQFGSVDDGRDMMHTGLFVVRSGGTPRLTITMDEAEANFRNMTKLSLPQLTGHEAQDRLALVLAGGPSLNDYVDEIRQKREDGAALITMNGTHDWALDHDLKPSMMIVADGQEHMERFLTRPQEDCLYCVTSTAHPKVFERLGYSEDSRHGVSRYNVRVWHSIQYPEVILPLMINYYCGKNFCVSSGGSTVAVRTLALLQMVGFRKIEAYGMDSCYGSAHAYEQPENAGEETFSVKVAGREFMCSGWQYAQALHFIDCVKGGGLQEIDLIVHGDGLIAWIIESGGQLDGGDIHSILGVQAEPCEGGLRP